MKRIGLILSILFCTTVFANNSYAAKCPSIKPDTEYHGIPVKHLDKNVYITDEPFYDPEGGDCVVPYLIVTSGGGIAVGLMSDYPDDDNIDYSHAHVTMPIEVCSFSELEEILDEKEGIKTLEEYFDEVDEKLEFSGSIGNDNLTILYDFRFQRCPITCGAGEFLGTDTMEYLKYCHSCSSDQCCLTESTTYTLSDYKGLENGESLCPVSSSSGQGGNQGSSGEEPTGNESSGGSGNSGTPAHSPLRVAAATHNAGENALVSAAYARGAYNANVANINNAIEYMEDSSVATINSAKVSADNVSLSVNGFTPSGTVSVNSSNATVSGTFNVPTTVALMDSWGSNTTTNATLGGIQQANITNGGISGLSATFTGTASGNLSGTGSFSNASVHVDGWKPVNPQ